MTISTKTRYIRTDGWRGYEQPINAICGASDTGSFQDSPCPSPIRKAELSMVTKLLRKNNIRYRLVWGKTSNVFSVNRFILVAPEDRTRAADLIEPLIENTRLLYLTK